MSSNSFSDSFLSNEAKILSSIALILTNLSVSQALNDPKTVTDSSLPGSKFCNVSNISRSALLVCLM